MSIGYACLTIGVPNTDMKNCTLKTASELKFADLILHNLNSLENIIDYNIENKIKLFRISSEIIPFASSPVNTLDWTTIFGTQLQAIGEKIKNSSIRVSMHIGQYSVLNSPEESVVSRCVADLKYHAQFMDSLGVDVQHKMILHIGGVYGDKQSAKERFIRNYIRLDDDIKKRLVIENDDKSYHIGDLLEIGTKLNIPVVYDALHNTVNCFDTTKSDSFWVDECAKTWRKTDGIPKIHYSQQDLSKKAGSHSSSIKINEFMNFYESLENRELDIMLEVKDKNLSAVKCINCTAKEKEIKALELEWSRYKYKILEKSPQAYQKIRELLRNKQEYPAITLYNLLEDALAQDGTLGSKINAAMHIWGYFKALATEKEKANFISKLEEYKKGTVTYASIKKHLWRLAIKYNQEYLIHSYYFVL